MDIFILFSSLLVLMLVGMPMENVTGMPTSISTNSDEKRMKMSNSVSPAAVQANPSPADHSGLGGIPYNSPEIS